MADAPRDGNRKTVLQGVSSIDGRTPTNVWVNPSTHAVLIDGTSLYTNLDTRYLKLDTSNDPLTNGLMVDGSADAVQLTVQGHSTQTSNLILFEKSDGTDLLTLGNAGQLALPIQGSSGGILLGGDVNLYRESNDILRTDDYVTIGGSLTVVGGDSLALRVYNQGYGLALSGGSPGAYDTNLYASAANVLQTDDSLTVAGSIQVGSTAQISLNTDGSAVFNEQGAAVNFRIEGDTLSNLMVTSGTSDVIAFGTTTSAAEFISVRRTFTTSSGTDYGIRAITTHTGASTGSMVDMDFRSDVDPQTGNTVTSAVGANGGVRMTGAGTLTTAIGIQPFIQNTGSGTIGTATIVNLSGVVNSGGGSITNLLGIGIPSISAGTSTNIALRSVDALVIFNENGDPGGDFRVEGDTDTVLLFTDASADTVGIGNSAPAAKLHITQPTLGSEVHRIESIATNDDPAEKVYQNRVTTTDATVTTIHTVTIPASTTVYIVARVVARRTGGSSGTAEDGAAYEIQAAYKNAAGTATEIGETAVFTAESQAGWNCTISPSSGNAIVTVAGAANNNVTWHATVRTYSVGS